MSCNSSGIYAFGNSWWWIIILILIFGLGNNGRGLRQQRLRLLSLTCGRGDGAPSPLFLCGMLPLAFFNPAFFPIGETASGGILFSGLSEKKYAKKRRWDTK